MRQIVAFSGGKDSSAMALRLAELGEEFELLFTPTGDELPELYEHLELMSKRLGKEYITPKGPTLYGLIESQGMLPSDHSRWCTRMIKILPCIEFLKQNKGSSLLVGLRADEETRLGLYGDHATYRYPLREWGWDESTVRGYLDALGIKIPARTDCALCPYQRIGEWYRLWKYNHKAFCRGIMYEAMTDHTIRTPKTATIRKDGSRKWAISLLELASQFEAGKKPETLDSNDEEKRACRVCSL